MGDVLAYISAARSTQAANAQAEGNAYTAQANASIANANAAMEAKNMETNLAASRRRFDQAAGASRSQFALLGFNGGSALDVMADLGNQGTFEQNSIINQSVATQTGFKNQSAVYRSTAANLLHSRQSPVLNGIMGAASYDINLATSIFTGGLAGRGGLGSVSGNTASSYTAPVASQP